MNSPQDWWKSGPQLLRALALEWQEDGSLSISICLPISRTEGKWFFTRVETGGLLWKLLQLLHDFPIKTLKEVFDYTGPSNPVPKPNINLEDLDLEL